MSNADRIEELRTKYEENPRRYFAPLANEYRKAGDLAQAISICREHLPKQPGHMSGYIVYGQTLFEANNLDEARTVFEQALTLDPENLIALKHLGDIARMNGENGVARRWYARVLDADPRNDDIASQLASLGAPTPVAPVPTIPEPAQHAEPYAANEAVGVFATFDPGTLLDVPEDLVGIAGNRDLWAPAPPEQRAVPQHEPLDLDFPESPEPVAEEDFEEGILAPEWPDTSELVARVVTPFHSITPVSVTATPDTLAAFGREAFDHVEATPVDPAPADELVEAFLPPDPVARVAPSDEPIEFATSEFEIDDFEPTDLVGGNVEASTIVASDVVASDVVASDVELPVESVIEEHDVQLEEHEVQFIDDAMLPEAVVAAATVNDVASDESFEDSFTVESAAEAVVAEVVANDEPVEATPQADEDLVWADSVVPNSAEPELVIAETFQTEPVVADELTVDEPVADADDLAFAAELPWVPEPVAELDALQAGVTAEFEIPEQFRSGAHATVTDSQPLFDEVAFEAEVLQEPVLDEVIEAPSVQESAPTVPEESFAEISSQVESERAAPFVTETMAELLVAQGFLPRAIEVYDELVRRRPHDPVLAARLTELRALHDAEQMPAVESSVQETFASDPTPRFNTPVRNTPLYSTPQYNTPLHNTPLSATPLSATPVMVPAFGESGATQSNLSERHNNDRLQAFRTARERFAELSRRRVARRTPTHATAVADDAVEGLSSLFGTAVPATTDELAARALADAFGPVQDSGESLFDPAPTPTPALPMRSLTPRSTTPVYTPAIADARADKQNSDRQPAADYSFDRFFPDPAMAAREGQSVQTSSSSATSSSQPVNEDLAQFSAWLKGLNNA